MGNIHDTETGRRAMSAWQPRSAPPRQTCAIFVNCARRLYEARFHGRELPVWYGGVALKAPQKLRDGSACESRWLILSTEEKVPDYGDGAATQAMPIP